jgi:hypothetical protein
MSEKDCPMCDGGELIPKEPIDDSDPRRTTVDQYECSRSGEPVVVPVVGGVEQLWVYPPPTDPDPL